MFARIAVAVAVGFVGAYPLAIQSGLLGGLNPSNRDPEIPVIVVSGSAIILFFLTLSLVRPTIRLVHTTLDYLGRVEERPKPVVALMMIGMGTLCAISAIIVQFNASHPAPQGFSMNLGGSTMNSQMSVQSSGSFGLGILTILTFLLGTSLIALGTWASLKAVPPATTPPIKTAIRELDEAMT